MHFILSNKQSTAFLVFHESGIGSNRNKLSVAGVTHESARLLVYAKCSIDLRGRSSLRNALYRDTDLVKSVFGFKKTMLGQCYLRENIGGSKREQRKNQSLSDLQKFEVVNSTLF